MVSETSVGAAARNAAKEYIKLENKFCVSHWFVFKGEVALPIDGSFLTKPNGDVFDSKKFPDPFVVVVARSKIEVVVTLLVSGME